MRNAYLINFVYVLCAHPVICVTTVYVHTISKCVLYVYKVSCYNYVINIIISTEPTVEHRYLHHQYDDDYPGICFLGEQLQRVVDSKGGHFAPADLGISLEVPRNAVPAGKTITLCGRPCLCGPFQYPEGYESLSAVYLITSKGSFQKEVELKMKHYIAVETKEQADQMCF